MTVLLICVWRKTAACLSGTVSPSPIARLGGYESVGVCEDVLEDGSRLA